MEQAVQVFSTRGAPVPDKAALWNTILNNIDDTIHVQARDPLHFDGTLFRQRVGRLTLFEIRCSGVRVRHADARPERSDSSSFQLLMPVQSQFVLRYGDQPQATVSGGSFCLIDRSRQYEMAHGDGLRAIGIEFPRALLESCLPSASRYAGMVVRPMSPSSRVLGGLLRALGSELNCDGAKLPSAMARSIAGFVAAAFAAEPAPAAPRGIQARLTAYQQYVDSRLGEADLRPIDIARHFNVSERYVRMVFQSVREPLSAFLLRRRLERAATLLRSAECANLTIMHIALECGFNSASHFGQSFREQFSATPRAYRQGCPAPSSKGD
jgi:AraC-like DNA-binding protein